jgi:DNA-directed RNA polymerase subunit RPC12/RpoP
MKILVCKICSGELEITDNSQSEKQIKCNKCGFETKSKKKPEVIIMRKR